MTFKKELVLYPVLLMGAWLTVGRAAYARDVIETANRLSQTITKFGMAISVGGVAVCGIYFIFGKQDATAKLIQCLIGLTCIWGVQTFISTISSIA